MSAVAVRRPALPDGSRTTDVSLELPAGLRYSVWLRIGEQLDATAEKVVWSIGDWRVYGDAFREQHSEGLAAIDRSNRRAFEAAAVSRAYPWTPEGEERQVGQRMVGVSWTHHERVLRLVKDPAARETWLNEVLRHGWSVRELEDRLARRALVGPRPPVLSVRASSEVAVRFEEWSSASGVPAKELALQVLSLAARLDDPIGVLEAAVGGSA